MTNASAIVDAPERPPRRGAGAIIAGLLGEILLTLGVLCALYTVWQVFWTDVTTSVIQHDTVKQVVRQWETETPKAAPLTAAPRGDYGTPPAMDQSKLKPAEVFGIMWIPRFGPDGIPLAEGTDTKTVLDEGEAGHYPTTAMPGAVGNFATAAHRTSYAKPYHFIADLREGDPIVVETKDAYLVYKYTNREIVVPSDTAVLLPVPRKPDAVPTDRLITLTACHPMYSLRERFIAHGVFDYWVPRDKGVPQEILTSTNAAGKYQGDL